MWKRFHKTQMWQTMYGKRGLNLGVGSSARQRGLKLENSKATNGAESAPRTKPPKSKPAPKVTGATSLGGGVVVWPDGRVTAEWNEYIPTEGINYKKKRRLS